MMLFPAGQPDELFGAGFVGVPLRAALVDLDHAAYVRSPLVIATHSDGRWPLVDFTVEQNRALVAAHEADHDAGRALTYALLSHDRVRSLGCLYLNPLAGYLARSGVPHSPYDESAVMVTFWVVQDEQGSDLPFDVVRTVADWLVEQPNDWLFRVLPGELTSVAALERAGLSSVGLQTPGDPRPYLWFARAGEPEA